MNHIAPTTDEGIHCPEGGTRCATAMRTAARIRSSWYEAKNCSGGDDSRRNKTKLSRLERIPVDFGPGKATDRLRSRDPVKTMLILSAQGIISIFPMYKFVNKCNKNIEVF